MELYDAIYKRRIVRDFSDKIVPDNILEKLLMPACRLQHMTI